jgi:hypothetical protein
MPSRANRPPTWGGGIPPGQPPPQPFTGPMPWHPVPARSRNPWAVVALVAAVVLVVVISAIGIWAATKNDDNPQAGGHGTTTTRSTTRTTTPSTTRTTTVPPSSSSSPGAVARLISMLPAGYPTGSCKASSPPMPGAVVSVTCGQTTDTNGPRVSTYGLFADVAALKDGLTGFTGTVAIQNCPGGKASPGQWWHTQDPKTVLGQVACGVYKGADPQVMWSNEQTLVFGLIAGAPQGPNLDQLYKWWASHS